MTVVTMRLELMRPDESAFLVYVGKRYPPISVAMLTPRALLGVDFFGVGAPCRVVEQMGAALFFDLRLGEEPHPLVAANVIRLLGLADAIDQDIVRKIGANEFRHFLRIGDGFGKKQDIGIDQRDFLSNGLQFCFRLLRAGHSTVALALTCRDGTGVDPEGVHQPFHIPSRELEAAHARIVPLSGYNS
jgi:hypothetical protein